MALCDASTVSPEELVSIERRAEERIGEIHVALFRRNQCWYDLPEIQMNEALLIKTFDSEDDGRTRFTIQTSSKNLDAHNDAPARESIETRCFVFF